MGWLMPVHFRHRWQRPASFLHIFQSLPHFYLYQVTSIMNIELLRPLHHIDGLL